MATLVLQHSLMALEFLKRIFASKPKFQGTPETFLAMMLEMEREGGADGSESASASELAEVFMKVMKINLNPYKSFADLREHGVPDFSIIEKIRPKIEDNKQRIELKHAIYGKNADLGEDDPRFGNSNGAKFTRDLTSKLSKHIKFKDNE
jgi:hypothetical protein